MPNRIGAEYDVDKKHAGKKVKCLKCQEIMKISTSQTVDTLVDVNTNPPQFKNKYNEKNHIEKLKLSFSNRILNSTFLFAKFVSVIVIILCALAFLSIIISLIFIKPQLKTSPLLERPAINDYIRFLEYKNRTQNTSPNIIPRGDAAAQPEVLLLEKKIKQLSMAYGIKEDLFYEWISALERANMIEKTEDFLTNLESFLKSLKEYYSTNKNLKKDENYETAAKYYIDSYILRLREHAIDMQLIEAHNISEISKIKTQRIWLGTALLIILCFIFLFTIIPLLIQIENNTRLNT